MELKTFLMRQKNIMKMFNTNVIEKMIMILGIVNIKIYDYKEIYL